jgi:hypothetical protein
MTKTATKKISTVTFITLLLSFSCTASAQEPQTQSPLAPHLNEQEKEIYFKHLNYEYGNRGRTYIGMRQAAKHAEGSEREKFFQAYYEMEVVNQKILDHMKVELGVNYEANWFVRNGIETAIYVGWRFVSPQQLIDVIIPYLPKLQEMASLASAEHKLFFAYIIAQEQTQLDASRAAKLESWDSGAKVIQNFIPQAEAELKRLLSRDS